MRSLPAVALVVLGSTGDEISHLSLFQGAPWLGWCQQRPSPFPHAQTGIEETGYTWNCWFLIWQHPLHNGTASRVQRVGPCCHSLAGTDLISAQVSCHKEKPVFTWWVENTGCFACITDSSSFPSSVRVTKMLSLPWFWQFCLLKHCSIKSDAQCICWWTGSAVSCLLFVLPSSLSCCLWQGKKVWARSECLVTYSFQQ